MTTMNQRVIKITYFPKNLPKFKSQAEIDEWHRAVGRMLTFGMGETDEDVIEVVNASITKDPLEFSAAFYQKIPAYNPPGAAYKFLGSNSETLDTAWDNLQKTAREIGPPFVMGAVQGSDGKFGFHS